MKDVGVRVGQIRLKAPLKTQNLLNSPLIKVEKKHSIFKIFQLHI